MRTEITQKTSRSRLTGLTGKRSFAIAWGDQVASLLGSGMTRAPQATFLDLSRCYTGLRREQPSKS
jgi:hypothetical protein